MLWRSCAKPVLVVFTFKNSRLERIVTPINSVRLQLVEFGYSIWLI
jgi:hypothetical protein